MDRHPARLALAAALACVAVSSSGAASSYSSLDGFDITREFRNPTSGAPLDVGCLLPGTGVEVRLVVTDGRVSGPEVEGFYLADHVPEELSPADDTMNALPVAAELTQVDTVYDSCLTRRWVLDEPPVFAGDVIVPGSATVITYLLTVPASAAHGETFVFPGFSWVGILNATDAVAAVEHYGFEGDGAQAAATLVAVHDDGDADGLCLADELSFGCDPFSSDTDGDGVSDGAEVAAGTDPTRPDSPPLVDAGSGISCAGGARAPGACTRSVALMLFAVGIARALPRPRSTDGERHIMALAGNTTPRGPEIR